MAQENIQNEIKWLEEQLEAKKRALLEREPSFGAVAESKEEREMVKDVIKEAASQNLLPAPMGAVSDDDAKKAVLLLDEKEHEEVVSGLVAIALSNGIAHAMKAANALRNPHTLDEFHDVLADKYYQKLLEARKIK